MLISFSPSDAAIVASWPETADEMVAWCGVKTPTILPETIASWSEAADVAAFVYVVDGAIVGYGELWFDDDEEEVELAHLIVDPNGRNQSTGRLMVEALTAAARSRHDLVVLRVRSENSAARRCYQNAGFERVAPEEEAEWNKHQPHRYVWMRAGS